jgi:predicted HD phosphohydrolase
MGSIAHAVDPIDEISAILTNRGSAEDGDECVTQRAQALQCA